MRSRLLSVMLSFVGCLFAQTPAVEEPTMVVEGRVIDMLGNGVAVASVRIVEVEDETKVLVRTTADGEGYFRLAMVPSGRTLTLRAMAKGHCSSELYIHSKRRSVTLSLQDAVAVRGVLTNRRGDPVPDAVVRAFPRASPLNNTYCDGRTDQHGRFELSAVPLAPVKFCAWVPGEGIAELVQHVAGPCEIALSPDDAPLTELSIAVEGLPADALHVRLLLGPDRDGQRLYFPPPHHRPQLDAQGRWQLKGAPDCDYTIAVSAAGFFFSPTVVRCQTAKGPHTARFTATPVSAAPLSCRAVVRDPSGKGVAGLQMSMAAPNGARETFATTDADGRVEFATTLRVGMEALIGAIGESWTVDQTKDRDARPDRRRDMVHEFLIDPTKVLDVRLTRACLVHGRLLDADGRPAPLVDIDLQESRANRTPKWDTMITTTSGRDGSFRFVGVHHLPDAVRIQVRANEGSFDGEPFLLDEPGAVRGVGDTKLQAPTTLQGDVCNADKRPLAGIRVRLCEWDLEKGVPKTGAFRVTLTDRQGHCRFLGVPVGAARVQLLTDVAEQDPKTHDLAPFAVGAGKSYFFEVQLPDK